MNAIGRVVHLLRNDVSRTLPHLAAFVTVAVLATARVAYLAREPACGGACSENGTVVQGVLQFVCAVSLMMLAATVVQGDAPNNPSAFWISQPVPTASLIISKLVYLVPVLLCVVIGAQVVSIYALGVHVGHSYGAVVSTLYWSVSALLGSALIATITDSTAGFLLGILGPLLLRMAAFSGFWVGVVPYSLAFEESWGLRADLWIVCASGVLLWTYLARSITPQERDGGECAGTSSKPRPRCCTSR